MVSASSSKAAGGTTTKRQRRQQPNDQQHLWPQHPNIRNPQARARAYLRTSGLVVVPQKNKTSDKDKDKDNELDPQLDLSQIKFGRLLGGTDARVRHRAVLQLQAYLKARCCAVISNDDDDDDNNNNNNMGLSELDLLQLWKALWYTLYMCDRVPVQQELCAVLARLIWCVAGTEEEDEYAAQAYMELLSGEEGRDDGDNNDDIVMDGRNNESSERRSSKGEADDDESESSETGNAVTIHEVVNTLGATDLSEEESQEENSKQNESDDDDDEDYTKVLHCRGAHLASLLVRTLFRTIRREWGKTDKYRIDKMYTLMRLVLREVYSYMAARHWNMGIIRLFNDAIFEEVLSQTPNGLRFHLIDIALDELAVVNSTAPMPLTEATLLDCLEPYFGLAQTGAGDHLVQERVVENVLDKFLKEFSVVSDCAVNSRNKDSAVDETDDTSLIMDQVHVGTVGQFIFTLASDGATRDAFRAGLYKVHKNYARRLKKVGFDVNLNEIDDSLEKESSEEAFMDEPTSINVGAAQDTQRVETEPTRSRSESGVEKPLAAPSDISDEPRAKKKKKKRKKEKGEKNDGILADAPQPSVGKVEKVLKTATFADSATFEKKKKKKRKRNKETKQIVQNDSTERPNEVGEQEVIISLQEQAQAKAAFNVKQRSSPTKISSTSVAGKRRRKNMADENTLSEKRVKFGIANRARSWKASMKGLRAKDPLRKDVTPDKSILLNKTKKRRAVDYF